LSREIKNYYLFQVLSGTAAQEYTTELYDPNQLCPVSSIPPTAGDHFLIVLDDPYCNTLTLSNILSGSSESVPVTFRFTYYDQTGQEKDLPIIEMSGINTEEKYPYFEEPGHITWEPIAHDMGYMSSGSASGYWIKAEITHSEVFGDPGPSYIEGIWRGSEVYRDYNTVYLEEGETKRLDDYSRRIRFYALDTTHTISWEYENTSQNLYSNFTIQNIPFLMLPLLNIVYNSEPIITEVEEVAGGRTKLDFYIKANTNMTLDSIRIFNYRQMDKAINQPYNEYTLNQSLEANIWEHIEVDLLNTLPITHSNENIGDIINSEIIENEFGFSGKNLPYFLPLFVYRIDLNFSGLNPGDVYLLYIQDLKIKKDWIE